MVEAVIIAPETPPVVAEVTPQPEAVAARQVADAAAATATAAAVVAEESQRLAQAKESPETLARLQALEVAVSEVRAIMAEEQKKKEEAAAAVAAAAVPATTQQPISGSANPNPEPVAEVVVEEPKKINPAPKQGGLSLRNLFLGKAPGG